MLVCRRSPVLHLLLYVAIEDPWEIFSAQATYPKTTDTATSDIVQFTQVDFNYAQSFNGSVFQPRTSGYFFIHLSYGKQRNSLLNVELRNADNVVLSQLQAPRLPAACPFSANHLVKLNHDQSVHVTSSTPVNYNNTDLLPTLVGFRFDNLTMKPFVAWQQEYQTVERPTFYRIFHFKQSNSTISSIELNFGKSTTTNRPGPTQISVPHSGIYVISMTLAVAGTLSPRNSEESVTLTSKNKILSPSTTENLSIRFYIKQTVWDNSLTMSLLYLLRLNTSDPVKLFYYIKGFESNPLRLSPAKLTLQLLLYSPAHGEQVAWAMRVRKEKPFISTCVIDVCVNVNVTCRDGVDLNNLTASNRVTVIHAGLYYVALGVAVSSFYDDVEVCVKVTKQSKGKIQYSMCIPAKMPFDYACHRADILHLNKGDDVSVHGTIDDTEILFSAFSLSNTL
jgi:hypothetical protein